MPIKSIFGLVEEAKGVVENLSVAALKAELGEPDVLLVDIRELQERVDLGTIPGAKHAPRGMLEFWADPGSPYYRDWFAPERRIVLFCAGGARSALAAKALGDMVCHPRCLEDHGRLRDPACFCQGSRIPLGPRASAVMTGRPGWWPSVFSRGVRRRARLARLPLAAARLVNAPHCDPMTVRGCHQGFWRRDLLAVNGLNEAMRGWGREDNELAVRLGNHGRRRRNLRGVALACHLHHGAADRRRLDENERILRETIAAGRVRCEQGLDQWVGDPGAWDYRAQHRGR